MMHRPGDESRALSLICQINSITILEMLASLITGLILCLLLIYVKILTKNE